MIHLPIYVFFSFQYEALHFSDGKSVIKSSKVKRRHREFTNLQSRLESHAEYKSFLKSMFTCIITFMFYLGILASVPI